MAFFTNCCNCVTCTGNYLQSLFLLLIRLIWGFAFLMAGLHKFYDIHATSVFFEGLGIPLSTFSAYLVAGIELVGGALLMLGLASRLVCIPLAIVLLAALGTAHVGAVKESFVDFLKFSTQPPIAFLLTVLTVFCFGPGTFSLDALINKTCCNNSCQTKK